MVLFSEVLILFYMFKICMYTVVLQEHTEKNTILFLEFYEEAASLVYDLTCKAISEDMWKVLELMYQVFQKDGLDYFTDMMPALHNYITVDTRAFLSNENHILAMFNMCKAVSTWILYVEFSIIISII